jgi:hypothetical protein
MFVKPKAGLKVRDPISKLPLPPEGKNVPDDSSFWIRRLTDGDVFVVHDSNQIPDSTEEESAEGEE